MAFGRAGEVEVVRDKPASPMLNSGTLRFGSRTFSSRTFRFDSRTLCLGSRTFRVKVAAAMGRTSRSGG